MLFLQTMSGFAQSIKGTVFDAITGEPLTHVIVENRTSGNQSYTDASGTFLLTVSPGDSIYFSMLSYVTKSLHIPENPGRLMIRNVYMRKTYFTIPEVEVYPDITLHQKDSLEERQIFGKKAEQKQSRFGTEKFKYMQGALTFLNPVSAPIEHFAPKYKRLRAFQKRFRQNERQAFSETRYTLELISRTTGLKNDSLIAFRNQNPLPYALTLHGTDIEIMMWTKGRFRQWIQNPYVPEIADSLFPKSKNTRRKN